MRWPERLKRRWTERTDWIRELFPCRDPVRILRSGRLRRSSICEWDGEQFTLIIGRDFGFREAWFDFLEEYAHALVFHEDGGRDHGPAFHSQLCEIREADEAFDAGIEDEDDCG